MDLVVDELVLAEFVVARSPIRVVSELVVLDVDRSWWRWSSAASWSLNSGYSRPLQRGRMDAEYLFVEAFEDLERRLQERTLYAAVRSAAILRQMFVDQHTLVAQAKKAYAIKLVFSVLHPRRVDFVALGLPRPNIEFLGEQIEGTPEPMLRTNLNHDQFLGYTVTRVEDTPFSVRDLIAFLANARGGVHLGPPDDDQVLLAELENEFPLRLLDPNSREEQVLPTVLTMRGITKVALDGLRPLYDAIVAKRHPARRVLHVLGFRQEIPPEFPGARGALLGNLLSNPAEVGPFHAIPPTQFAPWTTNLLDLAGLEQLARAMGYGTYKAFQAPSIEEIPPGTVGVYKVPTTVSGAKSPKALAWRRDEAKPETAIFRLEQDGRDVMAIWWEAERPILNFGFRGLKTELDCSWAADLYGIALFRWEPGHISIAYGTTPQDGKYEQRAQSSS